MKQIHGGDIYRNRVNMDFSVNINPLGMPDGVKEALQRAAGRCQEYPDRMAEKLKKAVSSMLSVPKEYLLFGNGASELFMGIIHGLRPKKTCIPIPSFYGYEYAAEAASSNIVFFPLKEEEDFMLNEDFFDVLTEDTDLLFLANPNNPTGKRMEKEYLKRLLKICKSREIFVVLDECFIEFSGSEFSMLSEIKEYDNLLLVRAFTKIYAIPGVRLGYLICSNAILLEKISRQLPEWNLSTFAQEAGAACACQSEFAVGTMEYVRKEREFLLGRLKGLGLRVYSGEANFILVYSDRPLYEELLQQGILIRDCANFRGLSKGYYRIAVKCRKDNEKLLKVIGEGIEQNRTFAARGN